MNQSNDLIGPYKLVEVLGRGGMGVVYQGRHQKTGKLAAIKTVLLPHPVELQSIRREIRALSRLDHPGIIPILDEGLERGIPWYAMELCQGKTLKQFGLELFRPSPPRSPKPVPSSILLLWPPARRSWPLQLPSGAAPLP